MYECRVTPRSTYIPTRYAAWTFSVNNILFKYKVHRDTTDTSYIQYNTFERDIEIQIVFIIPNSADPGEISHYVPFHQGLYCLLKYLL